MQTPINTPFNNRPQDAIITITGSPTNATSRPLDTATEKIEVYVRTFCFPQQQAISRDNVFRYLKGFTEFYHESKSLLKMKDDLKYCPPSCKITILLQPTIRVKESVAFRALANESARIMNNIGICMTVQVLKCKDITTLTSKVKPLKYLPMPYPIWLK